MKTVCVCVCVCVRSLRTDKRFVDSTKSVYYYYYFVPRAADPLQ